MNKDQLIVRVIDPAEGSSWMTFKNYEPCELFYAKKYDASENTHVIVYCGEDELLLPLSHISFLKMHNAASEAFMALYPQSPFFNPSRGFVMTIHASQLDLLENTPFLHKYIMRASGSRI